jgi:hypothetical protein
MNSFLFLTHGIGAIFYTVFSAAYILALPTYDFFGGEGVRVLTGEPIFHLLLSIFGSLFLLSIIILAILSIFVKLEK